MDLTKMPISNGGAIVGCDDRIDYYDAQCMGYDDEPLNIPSRSEWVKERTDELLDEEEHNTFCALDSMLDAIYEISNKDRLAINDYFKEKNYYDLGVLIWKLSHDRRINLANKVADIEYDNFLSNMGFIEI